MESQHIAKLRQHIEDEIVALQDLRQSTREARAPVELDQQSVGRLSRMDALQKQSMELATETRRQLRLAALRAALNRLEAGEYGACILCGEDIAPARLAIDIAVTRCIACVDED